MFRAMNMMPTMPPQTTCSCLHCTANQALYASNVSQACLLHEHPRRPAPTLHPQQPWAASEHPNVRSADRTVYLRASVFWLVYENIYLALTDSKLLGWYLALAPEDRKLIQDGGGFHQFLRKHSALELSRHHVYVKKLREKVPLYSNSANCYNHHQGHLHTSYCCPASQRMDPEVQALSELTWPMVNPNGDYYGFKNPEQFTNLSLEVELEKQTQGVNPQSTAFDSIGDAMTRQSGHETSQNEDFYSILEADQSIVLCVPNQSPDTSQINAGELISENEASSMESIIRSTEDRSTPVCARHVMVGTEQTMTMSALSQTDPQQMTDRHLNTEVYMSDLDYLTKEFIAIKTERDELLEKVKMQRIPSPLARIVNDLKKLETDSNKMKEKILSGIPLQDLKPFSLDEGETDNSTVTTMISDIQKASASSRQQCDPMNEIPVPTCDNNNPQESEIADSSKCDSSKAKKAVARVSKESGTNQRTDQQPSDALSGEEDWFDAEEEFSSEGSGVQLKEDEESGARSKNKKSLNNPPSSSKKKVVSVLPTAQATFVPQHYGTMGSFDTLMSELTQRHPNASRQRIVDALVELRAKYRGVLCGLPLRTIRDMTSDLLTRPAKP